MRSRGLLAILLATYCAATLLHFTHNAVYAGDYPNLPASLTAPTIYTAWLAVTSVGLAGCLALWRGWRIAGLLILAAYAALGFDGLLHYQLAPMSAHTAMMNFTILFEATAAILLLAAVALQMRRALSK